MWNTKCQMRNRFLHMSLPKTKPQAINEILCSEFDQISEVPYQVHVIKSIKPVKSKILGCDGTTSAFGNWALPKVMKKICSKDCGIQIFAMNKLCELIINEIEARRAILEFDIVKRLQNILLRRRLQKHKDQKLIPVTLRCFDILAHCLLAALQMCDRPNLINELYVLSVRGEHHQICSTILRTLTLHPKVIDYFVNETNWFKVLSKILKDNFIALMDINLLEHFSHFLQLKPQMAIEEGFFNLILHEIAERQASQQVLLKCFALLLNCREGQELLDDCDGITVLYKILMDEQLTTYQYIAQAFQNATCSSKVSLWRCKELWDLPHELIKRAHSRYNDKQQLYCLQTLRQITTMPSVKQYVRKVCMPQIRNIDARNENVKKIKEKLLIWMKSDLYKQEETVGE